MILLVFLSFFNLDFHNFNILFLANLAEIAIIFLISTVYILLLLNKESKEASKPINLELLENKINYFLPQIISFVLFMFIFLLRSQIIKYIGFYK